MTLGTPIGTLRARALRASDLPEEALNAAWERVCDAVRQGSTQEHACAENARPMGLRGSQLYEWGRSHPESAEAVRDAVRAHEAALLKELDLLGINEASAKADRVRATNLQWRLSKLDPARWGERRVVEQVGADGGPMRTEVRLTLADARALAKGPT